MDIQNALKKLNEIGMTDQQIAIEIGTSQSVINRLRNGKHKTTTYQRGEAIRNLFISKCPVISKADEVKT